MSEELINEKNKENEFNKDSVELSQRDVVHVGNDEDEESFDFTKSNLFPGPSVVDEDSLDYTKSNLFSGSSIVDEESFDYSKSNLFSGPSIVESGTHDEESLDSCKSNLFSGPSIIEQATHDEESFDYTKSNLFSGQSIIEKVTPDKDSLDHTKPNLFSHPSSTESISEHESQPQPHTYKTTLSNGRVIELKRKAKPSSPVTTPGNRNHFGIPIQDLLQNIALESELKQTTAPPAPPASPPASPPTPPAPSNILLSEKWRPKRWVDLMGPEKTHRHLLKWLVSWSHVVFRTDLPPISDNDSDLFRKDNLGRPQKKILLIHGPPGIGKTTIAHILAKQAGYDILEVNASDERSGQIVREKITTAVESRRIDKSGKPVCVVADEIEGAAESGFIRVLIDLLTSDQKALDRLSTATATNNPQAKKKKNKSKLLLRPIIAICNDVYAPALRTLRPYAEIVHYQKSTTGSIVTRLRDICSNEGIKLDSAKLTEIVNTAEGDLRSSLNMVQFGGVVDSNSSSLFQKDINQSWTKLTNRIFKRQDGLNKQKEAQDVLKQIHTNGEYDKIINGCFYLYPNVQFHDDMVRKPISIGDWLFFYEKLNSGIYQSQQVQLASYLGHPLQAFYENFSSLSNRRDQIVHTDYDFREAQMANKQLARDILEHVNPHTRLMFTKEEVCSELTPYVLKIISPDIQSVITSNIKLKGYDKARIDNSANAMVDLNLRFFQDRLESGTSAYRLDP